MDIKSQIRILTDTGNQEAHAYLEELSVMLGLPYPEESAGICDFFFVMNGERLELHRNNPHASRQAPLCVEFLSGSTYYRFIHDRTIRQPLAKAAGIKQGYRPIILDATAGFGEDSFVLAALGCNVTMVERSPVIWALLADGIRRCRSHPAIKLIFEQRVNLHNTEAIQFMTSCRQNFDTILLDPMYPHTGKSSLNKQKMRMLREIVGDDFDSDHLLNTALTHADKRVVVKRPARAEFLAGLHPSFSVTAKSSRYDIYLIPYL